MTRFVTWDVDGKGGSSALYKSLPTPGRMVEIYSMAVDTRTTKSIQNQKMEEKKVDKRGGREQGNKKKGNGGVSSRVLDEWASATGENASEDRMNGDQTMLNQQQQLTTPTKQWEEDAQVSEYHDLIQLMEEMLSGRNANRTSTIITRLVQYIITSWRYIHLYLNININTYIYI
jgi:hypothetical protein